MNTQSRGSGLGITNFIEDRSSLRSQLSSSDAINRPLALLPLNATHPSQAINFLAHISIPHREIGTTIPLISRAISTCTISLPSQISQSTSAVCNILPQSVTDASGLDLPSLFECPVCMDYALPPILQCQSGHIVCSACRSKLSTCPTCRGSLGKRT